MTGTRNHESAVDRIRERVEEKAARRAAFSSTRSRIRSTALSRCLVPVTWVLLG